MTTTDFDSFVCPFTHEALRYESAQQADGCGRLISDSGKAYPVIDGIAYLAGSEPDRIDPDVKDNRRYYERIAESYDQGMDWLFRRFHADEDQVRNDMVDRLRLEPGMVVLETGCGTGRDLHRIGLRLGNQGRLFATDLSAQMLRIGRSKLREGGVFDHVAPALVFFVGDATRLPFRDDFFDAAFHFGGLNLFSDRARGISEMARVVKHGGKVVFGDEGLAPWLRDSEFGKILCNSNPLYRHQAPIEILPEHARDVCLRWILGNAFYLIDFVVGDGPIPLDLDLPIPGARGGSHRTRYFGKLEGVAPDSRNDAIQAARQADVSLHQWLEDAIRSKLGKADPD